MLEFLRQLINKSDNTQFVTGEVITEKIYLNYKNIDIINHKFLALDVETTGLSADYDRIIELGAILYNNGKNVSSFSSLVNAGIKIPVQATKVNHITDQMLQGAPRETSAFEKFVEYADGILEGGLIVVAHNASFDMNFLSKTLSRLGYNGKILYVDTLSLSRHLLNGALDSYRLEDVAHHFGIRNEKAHRACSDAEVCGKILLELLPMQLNNMKASTTINRGKVDNGAFVPSEKNIPNKEELSVCAVVKRIYDDLGINTEWLAFYKNSANCVDISFVYEISKFKISNKGMYILINQKYVPEGYRIEKCSKAEERDDLVRVFFEQVEDLYAFKKFFKDRYIDLEKDLENFLQNDRYLDDRNRYLLYQTQIQEPDVDDLIVYCKDWTEKRKASYKNPEEPNNNHIEIEEIDCSKNSIGKRAVIQMDDSGNILAEYESISSASTSVGVNSKSIRDAANGKQKHAGGFCWKYLE